MKVFIGRKIFLIFLVLVHMACQKELTSDPMLSANLSPTARAGADQTVTLPLDSVVVDGSASFDSDGSISSYTWRNISLSAGNILNPNSPKTIVKSLLEGICKVELTVTDNGGLSAKDTVEIIVIAGGTGYAPYACTGGPQTITLPANSVTLGIYCAENSNIISYKWKQLSGPAPATIADPNAAITQATNLVKGVYEFELTLIDSNGLSGSATLVVTVQ